MVKTKKKEVQKQGLRPSQKAKAEKLRQKQEAKKATADLFSVNENDAQNAVSATEQEAQSSLSASAAKKTRAKVTISVTKDKRNVRKTTSATTAKKITNTTAKKTDEAEQPQSKENAEALKTITVKNADGDPDTEAQILIQNQIDYTPKVSVVIPVYNVENYLRECLDSIINQTLKEIEIICVDDGSTDASLKILKEYAAKDNRITVITQKNLHAGVARNAGLAVAGGEYLCFLDSDDFFEPILLEETYNLAEKEQSQIVFYQYTNYNNETKEKEQVAGINRKLSNDTVCTFATEELKDSLFTICNPMPWNKIIRRDFVVKEGLRYQNIIASNDVCFSLNILACSNKITFYYKSLLYYRHNRKDSLKNNRDKNPLNFFDAYKGIYGTLTGKGLYEKYKRTFLTSLASSSLWTVEHTDKEKSTVKNFVKDVIIPQFFSNHDDTYLLPEYLQNWLERVYYPDIVISLTSFPGRIGTVNQTIETLLAQSLKADRVILWLAPEQFPNKEADLPEELLNLRSKGLTIGWYHDIRSYKKLIPTLRLYPEAIIITADDDILYTKDCIKKLYQEYLNNPHSIIAHRISRLYQKEGQMRIFPRLYYTTGNSAEYREVLRKPNIWNMQTGCGAVLYPPHCFYKDILREDLIKQLAPTNDDQWFWAMTAMQGYFIRVPEKNDHDVKYVPGSQEGECLWKINDRGERLYFRDLENIMNHYPEIANLLNKQKSNNDGILQKIIKSAFFDVYGEYLKSWYKRVTHNALPLANPKTYNEKLQWLKLYNAVPIKTLLADKYLVREWVKDRIGEEYLVPLLGVYDKFDDIDFDALPNQFVMKCNHGSGWNIIVQDKAKLDLADAKEKIDRWMDTNFAFSWGYELHYRDITPKIIIEEYINPDESNHEIQAWCFNGKINFVSVESIKDTENLVRGTFYPDGRPTEFEISPNHYHKLDVITDKQAFEKAMELAEKMLVDVPYIRIDFIEWKGSVLFREMTFTSGSGLSVIKPDKYNRKLGDMIKLPKEVYNMDTKEYYRRPMFSNLKTYLMFPYYLFAYKKALGRFLNGVLNNIIKELTLYRLDIKNIGRESNAVEVTATDGKITAPTWFSNTQGRGKILQSDAFNNVIKLKVVNDGNLRIDFKGQDKRFDNERFPVWIDYKSIKIDGKEILSEAVSTWHNKPYRYEIPVKNGQEITLEVGQQYHSYNEDETKDIILKLNPDNDYIRDNISVIVNKLKKKLPIETMETYRKKQLSKVCAETIKALTSYRLDIKNSGNETNAFEITADSGSISTPEWFTNSQGIGKILSGSALSNTIKIKAINDGNLFINFRGQDRRIEGQRFPVWIDYKSIKVDGKEILSSPVATWHDEPYRYKLPVKDGQEITIEIEQQYHEYTDSELRKIVLNVNADSDYTKENTDSIMNKIKTYIPVTDDETKKRRETDNRISEIITDLTTYRVDIKNGGTESNDMEINTSDCKVLEPKWFVDSHGKGKMLQGSALQSRVKIKIVQDGILKIYFRGQDKRFEGQRMPLWIDYKSIKINGNEILSSPVATWHDKPYCYEIAVKDGQEITLEFSQQYHQYTEDELREILQKLYSDDLWVKDNLQEIIERILQDTNSIRSYEKLDNFPKITADCFIPLGTACRPAHWLRKSELRYCSLPFDWMMNFPLTTVLSTLKNGVSSWFVEYNEDESKKNNKTRYVTDIKNKIISMHGFPAEKTVDEYMPEFKEIFARRYDRLKELIEQSGSVCFVCNRLDTIYDFDLFLQKIAVMYPKLKINLLNIRHSDNKRGIIQHRLNENVVLYDITTNDIHANGNDKSNPYSWIGNEDLWNEVCGNLSLSEEVKKKIEKENNNKDSAA